MLDATHETVWLTQQQIADLFGTKRPAITKHLSNIYASGELDKNSTCSILEHMGNDGKQRYATTYYNLDAIISVGYRVNSINATTFRRWATNILREYLLQGYFVNRHLIALQENMDKRMTHIEDVQAKQQQHLDPIMREGGKILQEIEKIIANPHISPNDKTRYENGHQEILTHYEYLF